MNNAEIKNTVTSIPAQPSIMFYYIALVFIIILGSIERIYGIDTQSLWSDELFAVMASYLPFSDAWHLMVNDSHPPGYVTLMYWTFPWVGYSTLAIRLHALIFGVLWIPLVYLLGKRWFSRDTGLLAAAIIASSYSAIYFSQEARAYSMLIAVNLAGLICFLEILFTRECHRGYVTGFIVTSVISLYLHYAGFVFLAAEGCLYLLFWIGNYRKGSLVEIAKIFGIPLLVYLPWMGLMWGHLTDTSRNWAVSAPPTTSDVYLAFQYLWAGANNALYQFYLYGLVSVLVLTGYTHIKKGVSRQRLIIYALIFLLVIPALAFYIESIIWTPIFEKRYFLITLPLIALLTAIVANQIVHALVAPQWRTLSTLAMVIFSSTLLVYSNIDKKLYTLIVKDPVREAVNLIKKDLGAKATSPEYTVLMTHNWFEHYLQRSYINYDRQWQWRLYNSPNNIERVNEYIQQHPGIQYFYYLSLRAQNSDSSTFALKQRYKLLSSATLAIQSSSINVLKFSAVAPADETQIESAGTNNINEAAKIIARDLSNKSSGTYATLITHTWMEPYLKQNRVSIDGAWGERKYDLDIQSPMIFNYLRAHPSVDTLYYMALRSPTVDEARVILQLQYQLLFKKTVVSTVGNLDIYKFNTKATPDITPELRAEIRNNALNQIASWVREKTKNKNINSYSIVTSHDWFKPYLQANKVHIDETWNAQHYGGEFQSQEIFAHVNQHPAIKNVYYIRLKENNSGNRLVPLLLKYALVSTHTINAPVGVLEVFEFDTGMTGGTRISAFATDSSQSPIYLAAADIAKYTANAQPGSYLALMTHPFFALYLKNREVVIEKTEPWRFYTNDQQTNSVLSYLAKNPAITSIYYMAFHDTASESAAAALQKQYKLISKNSFQHVDAQIDVYRFDTKATPRK